MQCSGWMHEIHYFSPWLRTYTKDHNIGNIPVDQWFLITSGAKQGLNKENTVFHTLPALKYFINLMVANR
jgi:hypothetical protein